MRPKKQSSLKFTTNYSNSSTRDRAKAAKAITQPKAVYPAHLKREDTQKFIKTSPNNLVRLEKNPINVLVYISRPEMSGKLVNKLKELGFNTYVTFEQKLATTLIKTKKMYAGFIDDALPKKEQQYLINTIKTSSSNRHIPLTLITSHFNTQYICTAYENGYDYFLPTPLTLPLIRQTIFSMITKIQDNRRHYQRFNINTLCTLSFKEHHIKAKIINISTGGALLLSPLYINLKERCNIQFHLQNQVNPLRLEGQCVRAEESSYSMSPTINIKNKEIQTKDIHNTQPQLYSIAIRFINHTQQNRDLKRLYTIIDNWLID